MQPLADPDFWRDRAVLVTGHTGFKGAWLTLWLGQLGARVTGLSNRVPSSPSLYELACVGDCIEEIEADVRDRAAVFDAVAGAEPEIVIHMAAQPIVRRSYEDPHGTYETNVMGTVNVLEAVRRAPSVRVALTVTTDKCYDNDPARPPRPFVEDDPKGGHDPYSSSKGCAELVVDAYLHSFFGAGEPGYDGPRLASARAGNVIGGGDWGADRLIPDIMRAALAGAPIPVRNPEAVRPWQHVLNPLSGYLRLVQLLHADPRQQGGWNFGPAPGDARPVRWIADRLSERWRGELRWELDPGPHPPEAAFLALDSSKARSRLGWVPTWGLEEALAAIVDWYGALASGADVRATTLQQIHDFSVAGITIG
jgi:CDP-glucose 4,6-dehydratase